MIGVKVSKNLVRLLQDALVLYQIAQLMMESFAHLQTHPPTPSSFFESQSSFQRAFNPESDRIEQRNGVFTNTIDSQNPFVSGVSQTPLREQKKFDFLNQDMSSKIKGFPNDPNMKAAMATHESEKENSFSSHKDFHSSMGDSTVMGSDRQSPDLSIFSNAKSEEQVEQIIRTLNIPELRSCLKEAVCFAFDIPVKDKYEYPEKKSTTEAQPTTPPSNVFSIGVPSTSSKLKSVRSSVRSKVAPPAVPSMNFKIDYPTLSPPLFAPHVATAAGPDGSPSNPPGPVPMETELSPVPPAPSVNLFWGQAAARKPTTPVKTPVKAPAAAPGTPPPTVTVNVTVHHIPDLDSQNPASGLKDMFSFSGFGEDDAHHHTHPSRTPAAPRPSVLEPNAAQPTRETARKLNTSVLSESGEEDEHDDHSVDSDMTDDESDFTSTQSSPNAFCPSMSMDFIGSSFRFDDIASDSNLSRGLSFRFGDIPSPAPPAPPVPSTPAAPPAPPQAFVPDTKLGESRGHGASSGMSRNGNSKFEGKGESKVDSGAEGLNTPIPDRREFRAFDVVQTPSLNANMQRNPFSTFATPGQAKTSFQPLFTPGTAEVYHTSTKPSTSAAAASATPGARAMPTTATPGPRFVPPSDAPPFAIGVPATSSATKAKGPKGSVAKPKTPSVSGATSASLASNASASAASNASSLNTSQADAENTSEKHATSKTASTSKESAASEAEAIKTAVSDLLRTAREFYTQKSFAAAAAKFSEALALNPSDPKIISNRAACNIMLGHLGAALADCEAAVAQNPDYAPAYMRAGRIHVSLGELEDAKIAVSKAIEAMGKPSQAHDKSLQDAQAFLTSVTHAINRTKSAEADIKANAFELAEASLNDISELPDLQRCLVYANLRAQAAFGLKKYEKARSICVTSLPPALQGTSEYTVSRMPPHPLTFQLAMTAAKVYWAMDNVDSAERLLSAILHLAPSQSEAAKNATLMVRHIKAYLTARKEGREHMQTQNYESSLLQYNAALHIAMKFEIPIAIASTHSNRAAVYTAMGKYHESIEEATKALDVFPKHYKAILRRARARAALSDWNNAILDMRQVIQGVREGQPGTPLSGRTDETEQSLMAEMNKLTASRNDQAAKQAAKEAERKAQEARKKYHSEADTSRGWEQKAKSNAGANAWGRYQRSENTYSHRSRSHAPSSSAGIHAKFVNHYQVLEIPENADEALIRKAYKKAALKTHPDKPSGSAEKFKAVVEAQEILLDTHKRLEFDRELRQWKRSSGRY